MHSEPRLIDTEFDRVARHAAVARGIDIQCYLETELGLSHDRSLLRAARTANRRGLVAQLAVSDAYDSNVARHRKWGRRKWQAVAQPLCLETLTAKQSSTLHLDILTPPIAWLTFPKGLPSATLDFQITGPPHQLPGERNENSLNLLAQPSDNPNFNSEAHDPNHTVSPNLFVDPFVAEVTEAISATQRSFTDTPCTLR